ncbi:unnamed protein product [Caenorhabditis auriculariae]|uniref:Amino acid transporter transmembrane domain-containing protein n=1 Tax=Caenorhabditis auriculariae TaxID=2777116 RepID=A0A8S1GZT4_9PELO|nr:unnamed protein product [Caenorhabditis auriculariae]
MSVSSYSTSHGNELLPLGGSRLPTMQEMFASRVRDRSSISADQALIHMIKVMMGTGMLSLPLAFKHSGLWLGLVLLALICMICIYCTRQLIYGQHYITYIEWITLMLCDVLLNLDHLGFAAMDIFFKQAVSVASIFVFMADNLKQFFDQTSSIHISQAGWIGLLLIPIAALCTIRELKALAPLAAAANLIYLIAVVIVLQDLFSSWHSYDSLPAIGNWQSLPLFFGTVMFAFEGVAVVLPIENQMNEPIHFITPNGVLNTSCFVVLFLYMTVGFFGYLRYGNDIKDTLTLNLPQTTLVWKF